MSSGVDPIDVRGHAANAYDIELQSISSRDERFARQVRPENDVPSYLQ